MIILHFPALDSQQQLPDVCVCLYHLWERREGGFRTQKRFPLEPSLSSGAAKAFVGNMNEDLAGLKTLTRATLQFRGAFRPASNALRMAQMLSTAPPARAPIEEY